MNDLESRSGAPGPVGTSGAGTGKRVRFGVWALWVAGFVLAIAGFFAVLPRLLYERTAATHRPLAEAMLNPGGGWRANVEPLANTPEERQRVANILQYDDAIFVHYTRPSGESVDIYAAYWGPGREAYGLVGVHTPDTCWVSNGWRCVARSHRVVRRVEGHVLKPAEEGVYTFNNEPTYVMFWHLVGGQSHQDYGLEGWVGGFKGYLYRLPLLLSDLRHYSLNLAQDQLFVRISSRIPMDELCRQQDFQQLLWSLEPLGLFRPKPQPD